MGLQLGSSFFLPEIHRPTKPAAIISPAQDNSIPLIDLSLSADQSIDSLVSQIGAACEQWGFFQVVNHGIPWELLRRLEALSAEFFQLELEEKRRIRRDEDNSFGYNEGEHTMKVRDWKELFDASARDHLVVPASNDPHSTEFATLKNQWPETPPDFRTAFEEYTREVEKLAFKLLELICMSLGLPAKELNAQFDQHLSFLRINHYPTCPSPDLVLGVGPHKDGGVLAVLAQDEVGGLQVKRKSDGEWIDVVPLPDSYIINLGDVFQVWSNDKYESVEHRVVVNSNKARISIPYFLLPSHHVTVKPLEKLVSEANLPRYKAHNYGKFYAAKRLSNFKKDVENVQIHHYKI